MKEKKFVAAMLLVGVLACLPSAAVSQSRQDALRLQKEAYALKEKARNNEDLKKAAAKYEQAISIYTKAGDEKDAGKAYYGLGNILRDWGQYDRAMESYEKSLEIGKKGGDKALVSFSLVFIGEVYWYWGQYAKAEEYFEKGLEASRSSGSAKAEANALGSLGNIYYEWGQYAKTIEYYEKSLELYRKIRDAKSEAQTLDHIGQMYSFWGRYSKAFENAEKGLAVFRKIGDTMSEAGSLLNLGVHHTNWGEYSRSADYLDKAVAMFRKLGVPMGEAQALSNLGYVYQTQDEYDKALDSYQKALQIYKRIGTPTEQVKANIGSVYLDSGQIEKAERYIRDTNLNWALGWLALAKRDYSAARPHYEALLKSGEGNRNTHDLFTAFSGIGMVCENLGDDAGAAEYYAKAVALTEELRSSLSAAERETYFGARKGGFYRTAPYEGLARVHVKMNKPLEALKQSEYTKARLFTEGVSKRSEYEGLDVPKEVRERDSSLTDELAALKKNLQKAYETGNKGAAAILEPKVLGAKEKLAAHVDALWKQYPLYAATNYPQPMDLSQTTLRESEWVLSYDVGDPGLIVYLTKGKTLKKALFKPVTRKELDDLVRKFRGPLDLQAEDDIPQEIAKFDFAVGQKLGDILLAEMLPELPKGTPVIIVPADCLGVLPFEMLVLNDGGKIVPSNKGIPNISGAEFFGDRNPISYYQSITSLTLARNFGKQKGSGNKTLVMCDPVFSEDDPRLIKASKEERRADLDRLTNDVIMSAKTQNNLTWPRMVLTAQLGESLKSANPGATDVYDGLNATKARFRQHRLDEYKSIVFATHGYAGNDLGGLREPVLVLTLVNQPEGEDGFLRMSEVMGLKMSADVVALTACQTGVGKRISGEGTMGMGRAFQYAGARCALMTLWSVAQNSSVKLTESFFKHLREGKSKLEALKLARDEIRKDGYDHPFFWAPFILVGEVR